MYNTTQTYKRVGFNFSIPKINAGHILILILMTIFLYRGALVLRESIGDGGFLYVKALNFSMPLVEGQVYGNSKYANESISVKGLLIKTLGLDKITPLNIVGNEVPLFSGASLFLSNQDVTNDYSPFSPDDLVVKKIENPAFDPSLVKELNTSKPEVLIYHTHTIEAYTGGDEEKNIDTNDNETNVVAVGNELTKALEAYGISVVHDTTNNTINGYQNSYVKSNETVRNNLDKYGEFKVIIDLHRDSTPNKDAVTTTINNENLAKMMFVSAENNERYSKQEEFVNELTNIVNERFPGLMRDKLVYPVGRNAFNQNLSDTSILIECGAVSNTPDEAKNTAKYIATMLADYLNKSE